MDGVSGNYFAIQEHQGQAILNLFLYKALERSCAVNGIISFSGEFLGSCRADIQRKVLLIQNLAELSDLQLHDVFNQILRQPVWIGP
jgi:hypothetical protein